MEPLKPVLPIELFPPLHAELLALLANLSDDDWHRPTVSPLWSVKDIVAHLLDGDIRRLSGPRDRTAAPAPPPPGATYRELVHYLNQLNAVWVEAARRISPRLLIDFLEVTGPQVHAYFESLDPFAPALYPVAWAGEEVSPNWFDLAREYTEKWHHQQQLRDAVGAPGLTAPKWLTPVLDTFMRGLPHRYRDVDAAPGARVSVYITGEAGGTWILQRAAPAWRLYAGSDPRATTHVRLNEDTAWRLFTKGLDPQEARSRVLIEGDEALGLPLLGLVTVMA